MLQISNLDYHIEQKLMSYLASRSDESRIVTIDTYYDSQLASMICIARPQYDGMDHLRITVEKSTKNTELRIFGDDLRIDEDKHQIRISVFLHGELVGSLTQPIYGDTVVRLGQLHEFY